jgi:hypothetical protein
MSGHPLALRTRNKAHKVDSCGISKPYFMQPWVAFGHAASKLVPRLGEFLVMPALFNLVIDFDSNIRLNIAE